MLGAATSPPAPEEVARAAETISGGTLAGVRAEPWPRGRSHHAYLLTAYDGSTFLFKVHRRPHAGRMRRFLRLAELLGEQHVPYPRLRWWDVERRTLDVPYLIQEFVPGEDAARSLPQLSSDDQQQVGAELGAGLRRLHVIEYVDTPVPWADEFDERLRTRAAECRFVHAVDDAGHASVMEHYEHRRESLLGVERRLTHDDLSLANLLLQHADDGWHFVAFLDFERARGRDPLLDLVRLKSWTFPACPAAGPSFHAAYGPLNSPGVRERSELYEVYLLLAGIIWYRENDLPQRERFCRDRLTRWVAEHA